MPRSALETKPSTPIAAAVVLALLAVLAAAPIRGQSQEGPTGQAYIEVSTDDYVEMLRHAAEAVRAEASKYMATPVFAVPSNHPACRGLGTVWLGSFLREIAVYMEKAASAASRGDWSAFLEAKSQAYLLASCYPGVSIYSKSTVSLIHLLVSAEPSEGGVMLPASIALKAPALSGGQGAPQFPMVSELPGWGVKPPVIPNIESSGGGGGEGSLEVAAPQESPGSVGVDVTRLLDILARAREALGGVEESSGAQALSLNARLPSLKVLLVAAAAAAAYAGRGAARSALATASGLLGVLVNVLKYRRFEVTARECYREALKRVESETRRRKRAWETPREYLHVVGGQLDPGSLEWFKGKTEAYEAEVYGGRVRVFRIEDCVRGGRLARWRLAGRT